MPNDRSQQIFHTQIEIFYLFPYKLFTGGCSERRYVMDHSCTIIVIGDTRSFRTPGLWVTRSVCRCPQESSQVVVTNKLQRFISIHVTK